ncbi:MAG: FHA domain-containing protein, partial [Caldilineales bacterium]|nr:FHA domain-containing protein [Caldilineales bacterium]
MAEHRVAVITIRMADGRGQRHRLSRQPLTMGRDPGCDIHFDLDNVSRQHAHVQWTEYGCEIRDLDSRNGVWVNDERVSRKFLQPGDRISLGRDMPGIHSITFELVTEAEHEHEHRREERSSVDDSSGTSLGMLPLAGRNAMVIGRDPRCHLPLDSPLVSRQHARIDPGPQGSYIVTDLQSKNGTFVNGRRVTRAALRPGDRIRIGPFKFIYQPGNLARFTDQGCIRIEGIGLTRQVPTKKGPKTILNRVSLCIQPREFVALVGGSGAGKSTLLDALSGAKRASGAVRVNDEDLYASYDAYRSLMGYVPQEDIIHRELTVDSALRYAARLRLPPDLSEAEIEQRIAQALREVQL